MFTCEDFLYEGRIAEAFSAFIWSESGLVASKPSSKQWVTSGVHGLEQYSKTKYRGTFF